MNDDPPRDEEFMRVALAEAATAGGHGDVPIGAAVVRDGQVIAAAGNERELRADPTAHAEILALRAAAKALGGWRLPGAPRMISADIRAKPAARAASTAASPTPIR